MGRRSIIRPRHRVMRDGSFACTWQAGEAQAIAAALGVPVVSNFGPPICSPGDRARRWFPCLTMLVRACEARPRVAEYRRHREPDGDSRGRGPEAVVAFDTGPGNMVMDALALELFEKRFDRNGAIAARGQGGGTGAGCGVAQSLFSPQAAAHSGARTVRNGICGRSFSRSAGGSARSRKMRWPRQPL